MRVSLWNVFPVLAGLALAPAARGAFDAYLKLEGVEGEATEARHSRWIEVQAFAQDASTPVSANKVSFADLCLIKPLDRASPILNQKCAQGATFPTARLELVEAKGDRLRFYQIALTNVVITAVSASGQSADANPRPGESVCLRFERIGWTATEFDLRGVPRNNIAAWWDIAQNQGGNSVEPVLLVTGAQVSPTSLQLSWPAVAGRTYLLLGGNIVTGPFRLVQSIAATATGPLVVTQPILAGTRFFLVEQAP